MLGWAGGLDGGNVTGREIATGGPFAAGLGIGSEVSISRTLGKRLG